MTFQKVRLCEETDCDGCGKIIPIGDAWQSRDKGTPTKNAHDAFCMREIVDPKLKPAAV